MTHTDLDAMSAGGGTPPALRVAPRAVVTLALGVATAAIALVLVGAGVVALTLRAGGRSVEGDAALIVPGLVFGVVVAVAALFTAGTAERSIWASGDALGGEKAVRAARLLAKIGVAVVVIAAIGLLVVTQWEGLQNLGQVYLKPEFVRRAWPSIRKGFAVNIRIFVVTEILVLIWALVVAVLRTMPGRWAAPLRALSVVYIDLLRGLPAIITILLIGLGLRNLRIPLTSGWTDSQYAILALTLVYGAYVAEVYRAGIESVHPSQVMAARSLGLSYGQTMQHVVVPQAVRRVIPPLLNDFIGLQKDTALVSVIGVLDSVNRASFFDSSNATFVGLTVAAACFVAITIPLARFTDYLIRRDVQRMRAG